MNDGHAPHPKDDSRTVDELVNAGLCSSKYNPIERRFFPHVGRACEGMLSDSLDRVIELMRRTRTRTGLRTTMHALPLILVLFAAEPHEPLTSPADSPPEYGHGLSPAEASDGWISLFDGQTTFGWKDAVVEDGRLHGGESTTAFAHFELKAVIVTGGDLRLGGQTVPVEPGTLRRTVENPQATPIRLGPGVRIEALLLRPLGLKPVFSGEDLGRWKVIPHPQLPKEEQANWSVEEGAIRAVGGPGALELDRHHGDAVIQLEVRTRAKLANAGVFFRSVPGDFLNGYEAQIFNACYGHDPARPAPYSTGALDDRQAARRLVSRDMISFTMTIVAVGPQIAIWINGYQMIDWTDPREPHENPRQGLRLEPGTIQLQAHDPNTDVEFRRIRVGEVESP